MSIDNQLQKIKFTSIQIEEEISKHTLDTTKKTKNVDIENDGHFKIPLFVRSFYGYISALNRIPTQLDFWTYYKLTNYRILQQNNFTDKHWKGLEARAYRVYMSLLRELHAILLIRESDIFDRVIYNIDIDTKYGIDLIGIKNDEFYGIKLMVATRRSISFSNIKDNERHKNTFDDVKLIKLPLNLNEGKKINNFILYSTRQLNELRSIISQNVNTFS